MEKIERLETAAGITEFKNVIPFSLINDFNKKIDCLQKNFPSNYKKLSSEDAKDILCKLRTLENYSRIEKFCKRVSRLRFSAAFKMAIPDNEVCYVRCAHNLSTRDSHNRHFDSYFMTILVPIKTSYAEIENGDLIVYAKKDCSISTYKNLRRKTFTKLGQFLPLVLRKKRTIRHLEKKLCERITCIVGNVYFFNGYNIKHCNLSVSAGERRSLLLHAYDAGNSIGISKFMRLLR